MPSDSLATIFDIPRAGADNMATDEALLDAVACGDALAVLRFYEWTPATLSLGYFQSYGEREKHPASSKCPVVRRASGGGAIVHDRELTYSLALSTTHPLAKKTQELYTAVHQAIIDVLREAWSIDARFWSDVAVEAKSTAHSDYATLTELVAKKFSCADVDDEKNAKEPFLCFLRRAAGDLVVRDSSGSAWHKILGSAQRRKAGAILQHGSLILARSPAAPELAGLSELAGVNLSPNQVAERWAARIAAILGLSVVRTNCEQFHNRLAYQEAFKKFSGEAWLMSKP
jgi:lipoate-protein ligase A